MAQIMKPGSAVSGIGLFQRAPDQSTKHSLNRRTVEGSTAFGDKEVAGSDALIAGTGIVL
jgi:hypothetical protein